MARPAANRPSFFRPAVEAMAGYVPGEQPRDRRYVKLNTNENPYPPSPAVAVTLAALDVSALNRYPDPLATPVRKAAAKLFGVDTGWILVGNGSDDILTIATRAFVDQGEAVAFVDPTYSLYPVLAEIQGARTVVVPLASDFSLPSDLATQAADARLLFLPRPNAPTGNAYPLAVMERLCETFTGLVLIDEAYVDFADSDCTELARRYPNVIISRTLSKSYSLAGIRLGFAFAQPALIDGMLKVKDSYNVNHLTQVLGAAALGDPRHMRTHTEAIRRTRRRVAKVLDELGFDVCASEANFLFVRPPMAAADYKEQLKQQGVLVRHFPGPRTGDYVRVTIGTDEEMNTFLEVTRELC